MKLFLIILAIFWAALFVVLPTRTGNASQLDDGMRTLCGKRGAKVARLAVVHAAIVDPLLLGAVVASESGCKESAVGGGGVDIGLGQIRIGGSAARGYRRAALLRPVLNIRLTAEHLRRCLDLCDGWVAAALSVYRGHRRCVDSKGSRRVLRLYAMAKGSRS